MPAFYDYINAYNSRFSPSTVHCKNTALTYFYAKYLFQRFISVYKWALPSYWAENYFKYVLYGRGHIAIINTDKYGVIPQACGLSGYDVFYRPTNALIQNPLLAGINDLKIGVQCELIYFQPDWSGILDLISYYADLMAICSESFGVNLFNSRLAYVFATSDKTGAEAFKKMVDNIMGGDPAVAVGKKLFDVDGKPNWQLFNNSLSSNLISTEILDNMATIINMFDSEIGIPNSNTNKRERLIVDEVNSNNIETITKATMWLNTMKECCNKVQEMFNIKLDVDFQFKNGGENYVKESMDVDTGDLQL